MLGVLLLVTAMIILVYKHSSRQDTGLRYAISHAIILCFNPMVLCHFLLVSSSCCSHTSQRMVAFSMIYTVPFPLYRASYESLTRTVVYETVGGDDSDPVYETVDVVEHVTTGPDTRENVAYGVTERVSTTHNPAYVVVNTHP